jgi:hypothetical protein
MWGLYGMHGNVYELYWDLYDSGYYKSVLQITRLGMESALDWWYAAAFTLVQKGSQVARDIIVSTGFKSAAIIEVGSSVITVRLLTRFSLSEIQSSANTENLNINLQAGRIRVDVKPPVGTKASDKVQSPSAAASVRGTVFYMDTKNLAVSKAA